jgi:hypothetical protein
MQTLFTTVLSCLTFAMIIVMCGSVIAVALWLLKAARQIAMWFFELR